MRRFIKSKAGAAVIFVAMFSLIALAVIVAQTGSVSVQEPVSVQAVDLNIQLWPNQSTDVPIVINNNGPTEVGVQVAADILIDSPPGPWPGVEVAVTDETQMIPAGGSLELSVSIVTSNGVVTGDGSLSLTVIRP